MTEAFQSFLNIMEQVDASIFRARWWSISLLSIESTSCLWRSSTLHVHRSFRQPQSQMRLHQVNNSKPEAKAKMESTTVNPVKDSKPEANAKVESATVKPVKDITTAQKAPTEVKENATSNEPALPEATVAAATKDPPKPLPEMMAEDVIPAVKAILEKEEDISDIKLVFEDSKLVGSFAKGEN